MKQLSNFLLACFLISCSHPPQDKKLPTPADVSATSIVERLGISGPLEFNNTSFSLAWSDKPNESYYVQEYVPQGENVEHFNQLITINLFNKSVQIEDATRQKVDELNERKKTDPDCNYALNRSKDGKEFMVDFILSEGTGSNAIAEFNIYHYKQIETAGTKQALLVYAYSKRRYGNDITNFLQDLKTERPALLQAMNVVKIPQIKVSNK